MRKVDQEQPSTGAPYDSEGQLGTSQDKNFELRYKRQTQIILVHIVTDHPTQYQEGHREKSGSGAKGKLETGQDHWNHGTYQAYSYTIILLELVQQEMQLQQDRASEGD